MASRHPELNDSLETSVEKTLKAEQLRRVEKASQEPSRRRKSPFATVARTSHSPRPAFHPPRQSDPDEVVQSRPRFPPEEVSRRSIEEDPVKVEERDTEGDNYCLSVALSVLSVVVLSMIFVYSWASASAVK